MIQKIIAGLLFFLTVGLIACKKDVANPEPPPASASLYFPPVSGTEWQTLTPASLGWNVAQLNDLYSFLQSRNTKAFIVLKNGKIVSEQYFGSFTADSLWYWASAGKTMTAMLVGIAQQEGLLNINTRSSTYLGRGWTSLPVLQEDRITVRHQLTMTTGLDDAGTNDDCTTPACLTYKAEPGTRWAYHNAPYTLLEKVVENATGLSYTLYFQQKIRNRIGMNGLWVKNNFNNVYFSNARSMARFGLLMLNKGIWEQTPILNDSNYFNAQINSSQTINPSYGYLTWLNGKSTFMTPIFQTVFPGMLVPNAPPDMYCALGKDDQKIYVVPSQKLVVIRLGASSGTPALALSGFDNELWGRLKTIIGW
jgi:CubicO group peptidase (beta-lactamase class C family)